MDERLNQRFLPHNDVLSTTNGHVPHPSHEVLEEVVHGGANAMLSAEGGRILEELRRLPALEVELVEAQVDVTVWEECGSLR